ncbi:MAG: DUF1990 domain-containing protein [Sporichthyaceae bacterium]
MGILLRHPDLAELADQDVTYPEVGATAGDLPDGYRPVVRRAALGHGQATFQRCATALMTWEVHRASGIEVWASHSPAQPGTMVSQRLGLGPLGIVAPCKVVYVVEEADRRGFAYGTLPGHPESGEESFVVSILDDDSVALEIRSFSRPGNMFSRLGRPVSHWVQDRMTDRYVEAARRIAHDDISA